MPLWLTYYQLESSFGHKAKALQSTLALGPYSPEAKAELRAG